MNKICSLCKVEKPLTKEYFNLSKSQKDGFHSYCKDCSRAKYKEHYQANREHHIKRRKTYYDNNREAQILTSKNWQKNHPEEVKELKKRHSIKQSDHIKERVAKWKANNPIHARFLVIKNNYPHNELNYLTLEDLIEVFNKFALNQDTYYCNYCNKELPFNDATIDHVIPISKKGENSKENLVVACWDCNLKKGSKLINQ